MHKDSKKDYKMAGEAIDFEVKVFIVLSVFSLLKFFGLLDSETTKGRIYGLFFFTVMHGVISLIMYRCVQNLAKLTCSIEEKVRTKVCSICNFLLDLILLFSPLFLSFQYIIKTKTSSVSLTGSN
jgi:hypothetical protein